MGEESSMDVLMNTVYWAALISIGIYLFCAFIQKKTNIIWINPLLFSTVATVCFLLFFQVDYDTYYNNVQWMNYLLTPATVCLAVPLYKQMLLLKRNVWAILGGILSGVIASVTSIWIFASLFNYSHKMYVTLLPKSVTAAIAMEISRELDGIPSLTVPIVIMTGITGNLLANLICKLFRIVNPVAKGVAIGTSSHAMGTAKAIDMGEIEGAMSSISIAVAGFMTVIVAPIFSQLL